MDIRDMNDTPVGRTFLRELRRLAKQDGLAVKVQLEMLDTDAD